MPKDAYELLIDGELIEPLLAMWSVRLDKMDGWRHRTNRTTPLYDQLLDVYKTSQRAHTDLTSLHIYQKRNPVESEKVQRQLQIASVNHQKANSLYIQLLNDMSD
jgi:steroid 5-alpha reductase family enzyme